MRLFDKRQQGIGIDPDNALGGVQLRKVLPRVPHFEWCNCQGLGFDLLTARIKTDTE
jgi:hypothetical protein